MGRQKIIKIEKPGIKINWRNTIDSIISGIGEASVTGIPIFSGFKLLSSIKNKLSDGNKLYYLFLIPLIDSISLKLFEENNFSYKDELFWRDIYKQFNDSLKSLDIHIEIDMNSITSYKLSEVNFFKVLCKQFEVNEEVYKDFFYENFERDEYNSLNRNYYSNRSQGGIDKANNSLEEIKEILKIKNKSEVKEPVKALTNLPTKSSNNFVGREKDLEEIDILLKDNDRVLLVNGIGGIGKTELAKKIFWNSYKSYDFYGWINYNSNIKQSFVDQINTKDIDINEEDIFDIKFKKIYSYLTSLNSNSLLIVDNISNIDDESLKIINSLDFKVITTSREKISNFKAYNLGFLSDKEAKELFYKYYEGIKDNIVDKIIKLSGNHTLTIELLAKVVNNMAIPLNEFYNILIKEGFTLDGIKEKIESIKDDKTINEIFFEHLSILFDLSNLTEQELHILINLSILPAEYIEINNVKALLNLDSNNDINSLVKKGWLIKKEFKIFMHNVIQEVVRKKKSKEIYSETKSLTSSVEDKLDLKYDENPYDKISYVSFAESILNNLIKIPEMSALFISMYNSIAIIYQATEDYEQALKYSKIHYNLRKEYEFLNKGEFVKACGNLALIYRKMGKIEEALKYIEESKEYFNDDILVEATQYNNEASALQAQGYFKEALSIQEKATKIFENELGEDDLQTAKSYNNESLIYYRLGKVRKAIDLQLKSLKVREESLDRNNPILGVSYASLRVYYDSLSSQENNKKVKLRLKKESKIYGLKAIRIKKLYPANNEKDILVISNSLEVTSKEILKLNLLIANSKKKKDIFKKKKSKKNNRKKKKK